MDYQTAMLSKCAEMYRAMGSTWEAAEKSMSDQEKRVKMHDEEYVENLRNMELSEMADFVLKAESLDQSTRSTLIAKNSAYFDKVAGIKKETISLLEAQVGKGSLTKKQIQDRIGFFYCSEAKPLKDMMLRAQGKLPELTPPPLPTKAAAASSGGCLLPMVGMFAIVAVPVVGLGALLFG